MINESSYRKHRSLFNRLKYATYFAINKSIYQKHRSLFNRLKYANYFAINESSYRKHSSLFNRLKYENYFAINENSFQKVGPCLIGSPSLKGGNPRCTFFKDFFSLIWTFFSSANSRFAVQNLQIMGGRAAVNSFLTWTWDFLKDSKAWLNLLIK